MRVFYVSDEPLDRSDPTLTRHIRDAYHEWEEYMRRRDPAVIDNWLGTFKYPDKRDQMLAAILDYCKSTEGIRLDDLRADVREATNIVHDYMFRVAHPMVNNDEYLELKGKARDAFVSLILQSRAPRMTVKQSQDAYPLNATSVTRDGYYTVHPLNSRALISIRTFFLDAPIAREFEMIDILRQLGARSLTIDENNVDQHTAGGSASVGTGTVGVDVAADYHARTERMRKLAVGFTGKPAAKPPTSAAGTVWNQDNPELDTLIKGRQPGSSAQITAYSLTSGLHSDYGFDFDLSAAVSSGAASAKLKAEFSALSTFSRTFDVKF